MDQKVLEVIKKEFTGIDFSRVDPSWSEVQVSKFLVGTIGINKIGEGIMKILSDRSEYPEPFTGTTIHLYKTLIVVYALAIRVDGRSLEDEEFCKNFSALLDQF